VNHTWLRITIDAWFLGLEVCNVMALRTVKLALGGPHAKAESRRMLDEKIASLVALQWLLLTGGLGTTAPEITRKSLRHYRRAVQRNRYRLTRPPS
jgi:hypothetical protein